MQYLGLMAIRMWHNLRLSILIAGFGLYISISNFSGHDSRNTSIMGVVNQKWAFRSKFFWEHFACISYMHFLFYPGYFLTNH